MEAAPLPLSTPHKYWLRNKHFNELTKDTGCGTALAAVIIVVITAHVPSKTADIRSFATPVVLLKKNATTMEELKRRQGAT